MLYLALGNKESYANWLGFLRDPVQQAANRLGYNVKYLYRLPTSGKVNGQRVGHIWLIDRQEVERVKALRGPGGRLPKEPIQ